MLGMFQNLRFLLYNCGRFGGRRPSKNSTFLALAEVPLCQSQKSNFRGGGHAAPAPPLNCKVSLKHALAAVEHKAQGAMGRRPTDCASAAAEGARHKTALKSLRSRAPKAVRCNHPCAIP